MSEPTIICPNCKTEIKLTESLAAPLLESTRREYEKRLAQKNLEVTQRETSLRGPEEATFEKPHREQYVFHGRIRDKLDIPRGFSTTG